MRITRVGGTSGDCAVAIVLLVKNAKVLKPNKLEINLNFTLLKPQCCVVVRKNALPADQFMASAYSDKLPVPVGRSQKN